jgi:hypothetical protein
VKHFADDLSKWRARGLGTAMTQKPTSSRRQARWRNNFARSDVLAAAMPIATMWTSSPMRALLLSGFGLSWSSDLVRNELGVG